MMSATHDQFTVADAEYHGRVNSIYYFVTTSDNAERLGIISKQITKFKLLLDPVNAILETLSNPEFVNKINNQTKKTARSKLNSFLRKFSKQWFYNNPDVSEVDIMNANLELHSDERVNHQGANIPKTVMSVEPQSGHQFLIYVKTILATFGKPVNIVFIRIRYHIGDNIPVDICDFLRFIDRSRNPIKLLLKAEDKGKDIAISSCYVDAQGMEGTYSTLAYTNVP